MLTIENTDSDLKVHALHYVNELLVRVRLSFQKTFAKSLNIQNQYENNGWEKSNDAYSLSIRVQTTINHISIFNVFMFFTTISTSKEKKCFLSERELKKALRDTLTRAAWLGPSNFWLVRSEHAHASYPGLFSRPPGFSPYIGREERRVQGLDKSMGRSNGIAGLAWSCLIIINLYLPSAVFITQVLVGPSKQLEQIFQIQHNIVKNPNWPEASQLAIYKRAYECCAA